MTQPFSSGLGGATDNELTLRGEVNFSRAPFSPTCRDFISKLLHKDRSQRLGVGREGWRAVMAHPFFRGLDWGLLEEKVLASPCVPSYKIPHDWANVPEKSAWGRGQ